MHYGVLLHRDAEEPFYVVTVPALPGCFTQGATVDQALDRAREAIALHVEGDLERGEPGPVEVSPPLLTVVEIDVPELVAT